ncbi:orange carotenoid protein N-terminal domain-containing protein [Leptolyngbya sp. FACHB-261]|uniref:orange carotenoid protein N-terminal domain-containing protein n=1 Tax=Leptolyngbya sp. FACHB-261 TaxID=2692806 RepID=UPI0016820462|nr:orange carotenoid protein N-terminal domain-containing protein [Leptolyngbya sp. FACHB-261]MBD2103101.1 Orange carotenoid protein [Leptolyngbya sp. FACHB-261]
MTFTNASENLDPTVESIQRLNADDQLALLWFFYTDIKDKLRPGNAIDTGMDLANALIHQVQQLSADEQLQAQRDVVNRTDNQISRTYGSFSASAKLAFWYRLSQEIEQGTVVPVPANYKLPDEAQNLFDTFKSLDFEEQIALVRKAVFPMGTQPREGVI